MFINITSHYNWKFPNYHNALQGERINQYKLKEEKCDLNAFKNHLTL